MITTRLKLIPIALLLFFVSCNRKSRPANTGNNNIIKVMTYNVHHCNPPAKPGVIDVDAIAAAIKKQNADIVALQEIDVQTNRSGKINEAEQLALKAGFTSFYFAKAIDFDGGQYGIAILSKYPLSGTKTYALPTDETIGGEHRALAAGTIKLANGKTFLFGCTHLDAEQDDASRLLQVKEIRRIAGEAGLPFIIAGDFNTREGGEIINILDTDFERTCNQCAPTFLEDNETGAIDFIASKPKKAFSVVSHAVIPEKQASDHMPVMAVLQLNF